MSEDTLILNVATVPSFHSGKRPRTPYKPSDKWKKRKAQKRKAAQLTPKGPSAKKVAHIPENTSDHVHQTLQHDRAPKLTTKDKDISKGTLPVSARKPGSTEKPSSKSEGTPELHKKSQQEDRKGEDRPFIKTSSLFKNNPDIPDIHKPAVTQLKETMFTSDSFADLELHPHLVSTLNNVLKVTSMTSVQKRTIPVLLAGRDAVVRSQTGSGKTLAYGIPLVQSLQAIQPKIKRADGPFAVIVVPTRELAQQSFQIIQKLLKPFTWIVPGVLMGGEKRKSEKARLRKGINILIATPGRLVDHINNTLSIAFSAVRWLVLDEADRTLDLGFEKDLTVILNAINTTSPCRQNVLLSATLTEGVSRLAGISVRDPVSIHVGEGTEECAAAVPQASGIPHGFAVPEKLKQYMVLVPSKLRLVCLGAFILGKAKFEKGHKLIVFLSSCEAVEFLLALFTTVLCKEEDLSPSSSQPAPLLFYQLHGNMMQEERMEVFKEFSQCKTGILLCTDVAARGLDLPQVTWIVQYNPPASPAEYVHRVGRTARIGAQGSSLLFLTPSETAYINVLADHNISMSEMKVQDILANLMLDDQFKGRGKWGNKKSAGAIEQEVRERATVLQTEFENAVHANKNSVQSAKKALQSFLRAYTTYPAGLKRIFHIRSLHLGHAAKSFGLRDAPQGLSTAAGGSQKSRKDAPRKTCPSKTLSRKERAASLLHSEYASGLEGISAPRKKKPKQMEEGTQRVS
ncbi:probable ATP-dependent RNA helicase DDX31 isoform X2 [Scleropages formosus]|uniref:ATP-dependent RNA helicase n=2 Tax=Scleropages formosus TaxID=113540 RepID=A0A8C9SVE4_SCLFO|nr:probable ATP-dependent RNA helicase DDX31 isoform X2 [Scleropages formosus]XP_018614827.1 probable ATP-dependent RNA helicase DDX31 isoform X2 [Scleropages formosus]